MRFLPLLAVALVAGCRAAAVDHAIEGDSTTASELPLQSADLLAYQTGREREIESLHAGRVTMPGYLDSVGAAAARLPVEEYRRLVAAMDEYLKVRSARVETGASHRTKTLDSALLRLDSLRVERLVLMVRMGH